MAYSKEKTFDSGTDLLEMYNLMVKDLHGKINPLKYAMITVNTSRQFAGMKTF